MARPPDEIDDTEPRSEGPSPTFVRLTVATDGCLVLPRGVPDAFGSGPGEVIVGVADRGELILRTPAAAVAHVQSILRRVLPRTDGLVDSLLADRRREAESEETDLGLIRPARADR
ncbi:MAG: hypothetical protein JO048_07235 [Methylobacteriaceae bacterium]|nr:hypothetical protein [Methylobacteriaceae bacterium]